MNTPKAEWPSSLNDTELEELDRYLRTHGGDGDLMLDGVHGLDDVQDARLSGDTLDLLGNGGWVDHR